MTPHPNPQRKNHRPVPPRNPPLLPNNPAAEHHHRGNNKRRDDDGEPEAAEDLGDFYEEVRALDFFLRRALGDIVGDAVREEGLGDVD